MIDKHKIQRYFPSGVIDKIISFEENPFDLVENRYAVIMFADISGYTAISERLKPEEVSQIINRCFSILIDIVEQYNGYVDKFIGDCILCVFGINNGEIPELSSCLCALKMQEGITELNKELKTDYDFDFNISIGIHCGNLLLGNIGSVTRMDYTVIGDIVNTASRIQNNAKPGEILISKEIFDKVESFVYADSLLPIKVKNKKEPLTLFRLTNKKETKVSIAQKVRLVGRENEIKTLKNILTSDPEKKVYIITGENGSGKSRIIEEFSTSIVSDNIISFSFSGSVYTKNFEWAPFRELFTNFSNFLYLNSFKNLNEIYKEFEQQNTYLENFFIHDNSRENTSIYRESLFDTFRLFFKSLSEFRKIILIFEDIHFIDPSSLELLKYLFKTLKNYNIFFIVSKRSDYDFDVNNSDVEVINALNLTKIETEILTINYLDNPINHSLNNFLYDRSNGNPFYLIEMIETLKHNNILLKKDNVYYLEEGKENIIPDSISGIIMSKIEKLTYKERHILNMACFFGYSVRYNLLKMTTDIENFDDNLDKLIKYGYLYEYTANNRRIISFKSQITVHIIYGSIIERKKTENHLKIANILKDLKDNDYEKIGYHFEMAKKEKETVYYYFLTGLKYRDSYDFETAIKYFDKALYYAEKKQNKSDEVIFFHDTEIEITDFSRWRLFFKYPIKVKLSIELIYYIYGESLFSYDSNLRTFFEKAYYFAEKNKNTPILILSRIMLLNIYIYFNENIDFYSYLDTIEKKVKSLKNDFYLAYFYLQFITLQIEQNSNGKIDEKRYKIILERFHTSKKIIDKSNIDGNQKNTFLILWYWHCGLYYKSINKDIKTIMGVFNLGEQYISNDYEKMSYYDRIGIGGGPLENTEEQIDYLKKALELSKKTNSFLKTAHIYSTLAYVYMKREDYQKSLEFNINAEKICKDIDNRFELGMIYKNLGDLYIAIEQFDESIESYLKSIKFKSEFISCQTIVDFANIILPYTSLAFLYTKKNNLKDAENMLFKCYELLSKYHFGREITLPVEFIKNYVEFKQNKNDPVYLNRMNDYYKELFKNFPDFYQVKWLKKELKELDKK